MSSQRCSQAVIGFMVFTTLAVVGLAAVGPTVAQAEIIYQHEGSLNPQLDEGWDLGVGSGGFESEPRASENAWRIADNSSGSSGPGKCLYKHDITDAQRDLWASQGWVLRLELRVEDATPGTFGSVGARVDLDGDINRLFMLYFSVDDDGNPIARVHDGANYVVSDPIPGTGYHTYEMVYDPDTTTVDIYADGSRLDALSGASGYSLGGYQQIYFGANSTADTGVGYYRKVEFAAIPEPNTCVFLLFGGLTLALGWWKKS